MRVSLLFPYNYYSVVISSIRFRYHRCYLGWNKIFHISIAWYTLSRILSEFILKSVYTIIIKLQNLYEKVAEDVKKLVSVESFYTRINLDASLTASG